MVGVHAASLPIDVPLLVQPTAAAHILAGASHPIGGGLQVTEAPPFPVVGDGDDLLFRATGIGMAIRSIKVEVLPTPRAAFLLALRQVFRPFPTFVRRHVPGQKPPRRRASRRSWR